MRHFLACTAILFALGTLSAVPSPKVLASADLVPIQIETPDQVVYGHRPIIIKVTVANAKDQPIAFFGYIYFGGVGWGRETHGAIVSSNSEILWMEENTPAAPNGVAHWWRGTVEPGGMATFSVQTFSGVTLGRFDFLDTLFVMQGFGSLRTQRQITLVQGGGPSARLTIADPRPGQPVPLQLELESPTLTQFVATEPFVSSCGVTQLPTGFVSHANRTLITFTWHVTLPDSIPNGCTIWGKVEMSGRRELIFPSLTFVSL